MGIFLEKLDQDLQAPDQELKTLALLKILRLESTFIEDSEYVDQLIQTLRRVFYHQDDQSARLSILGMVRLEGILPEQPQSEERREEALTVLRDPKASTQATLKALWTLVVQAKPEDIFLCASFLNNSEPKLRLAALEVFFVKASIDDLNHLAPSLADPFPSAKFLANQILLRFDSRQITRVLGVMKDSNQLEIRQNALLALQSLDPDPQITKMLLELTYDPAPGLKINAILALSKHPKEDVSKRLGELQNDLHIEVCEAATKALENLRKEELDSLLIMP